MPPLPRLALPLVSIAVLAIGATAAEWSAAARIGARGDTTYARASDELVASWGGPLVLPPARFTLERRYTVREASGALREPVDVEKVESIPLVPLSLGFDATLRRRTVGDRWLSFPAYEVEVTEVYTVRNDRAEAGSLLVQLERPEQAALLHDVRVEVDGEPVRPTFGEPLPVRARLAPGEEARLQVGFATRGTGSFRYQTSALKADILPHLAASVTVDSDRFVFRPEGLATPSAVDGGTRYDLQLRESGLARDLGVDLRAGREALPAVRAAVQAAPVALVACLGALLAWGHVRRAPVGPAALAAVAVAHTFYFLFCAYVVRYTSAPAAAGVAAAVLLALYGATVPGLVGRSFAWRIGLPYVLLLTVGHTATFLVPELRGLGFVTLIAVVFASAFVPLVRAADG